MNAITRIVLAGDLPEALRGDLDPAALVRVTVAPEPDRQAQWAAFKEACDRLSDEAQRNGLTEEILQEILDEAKAERIAARASVN